MGIQRPLPIRQALRDPSVLTWMAIALGALPEAVEYYLVVERALHPLKTIIKFDKVKRSHTRSYESLKKMLRVKPIIGVLAPMNTEEDRPAMDLSLLCQSCNHIE